jgi:hypothetical protein
MGNAKFERTEEQREIANAMDRGWFIAPAIRLPHLVSSIRPASSLPADFAVMWAFLIIHEKIRGFRLNKLFRTIAPG